MLNTAALQAMGELHLVKNCLELPPTRVVNIGYQMEYVYNKVILVTMRIWPEPWTAELQSRRWRRKLRLPLMQKPLWK